MFITGRRGVVIRLLRCSQLLGRKGRQSDRISGFYDLEGINRMIGGFGMRSLQVLLKPLAIGGFCAALIASAPGLIHAAPEAGGWGPLIGGYNRTGQRLFRELAKTSGNVVLSPYSIGTAMAMAQAGARGETQAEM